MNLRHALACAALLLGGAQAFGVPAEPDGAVAPLNSWLMEGGCPSRSGRTLTPAISGPVETAWETPLGGEIEGEPLVADMWAFVSIREAASRTLCVVDLGKGTVVAKRTFRTTLPLLACIGPNLVALRTAPNRVECFRWKAPELTRIWGADEPDGVESLLVAGREIYVRHGGSIARFELGRRAPSWDRASNYRGRLALRGDRLYTMDYSTDGRASLVTLSRELGTVMDRSDTGFHRSGMPNPNEDIRIGVFARRAFVQHARPIATTDGDASTSSFDLADGRPGKARLHDCVGESAECEKGWIAIHRDAGASNLLLDEDGKGATVLLADSKRRPELAGKPLAASFARDTALIAGAAVNLETGRVLWRSGRSPAGRLIPARNSVLAVERQGRLVCLREARGAPASARIAAMPAAAFNGRAALRDGTAVSGSFTVDAAAAALVLDVKPPRRIALTDVLLVRDAAGALVCAGPDADDIPRGMEILLERERTDGWRDLAKLVATSRDEALLRHVVTEAWIHGCSPADVADAEGHLRDLSQPGKSGKPDPALAQKVAEAQARLGARTVESLWDCAKSLPPQASPGILIDLLRAVLAVDPAHAEAIARVRSILPPSVAGMSGFSAADWLDFAEAVQTCPVTILPPPRPDASDLTQVQRTYGSLLYSWRRDLVAFQSEHLVLISPIARPGALARCLSMGELVSSSLEKLFAGAGSHRKSPEPLVVTLCDSLEVFKSLAKDRRPGDAEDWTWGSYLPGEERSIVFLPDDEEGFRTAAPVFAYLLAQQWLEQRCPAFSLAQSRAAPHDRPGFWIESGFPKLVGEMRWDLRRRTWTRDPGSETPGFVAHVPAGAALSWPRVLATSAIGFWKLDQEPKVDMVVPDRLGWHQGVSEMTLFDFQASALAQFLFFGEDGKFRQKLLDFVGAYNRGEPVVLDTFFGLDAEALGQRASRFATSGK